ncbi:MAG TPA: heavy metal-responsive transcriptional regulator [Halalkalibaculum sp.]|nr:heavy metal-responsive transcriptional regulator [Halalkalibaculum sp.]
MKKDLKNKYDGVATFKIGEVASRAGVNKETVRYYEKRELIPEPDRRRSGYRIFTKRHIDQIKFIKRAQELGFTLSEIKELLELRLDGNTSCEQVRKKAESKLGEVEEKIKDLKGIKTVLGDLIDNCRADRTTEECVILSALEGEENDYR